MTSAHHFTTSLAAALLTLGLAHQASAATSTSEEFGGHGSACVPRKSDRGRIEYSASKGAYNTDSSASAKVYCSIPMDANRNGDHTRRDFWVTVIDNNGSSGADVSCQLVLHDYVGTPVYTSPVLKTSGARLDPQVLRFEQLPTGFFFWWAHVSCTLPKKQSSGPEPQIRGFIWIQAEDRP